MENNEAQNPYIKSDKKQNIWDKIEEIGLILENSESEDLSKNDKNRIEELLSEIETRTIEQEWKLVSYFNDTLFNKLKSLFPNNPFFDNSVPQFIDSIDLLVDWNEAFKEIINQIESAKSSIEITIFIWRDDKIGNLLAKKLIDAANRGVKIIINKDRLWAIFEHAEQNKRSFFHPELVDDEKPKKNIVDLAYENPNEVPSNWKHEVNQLFTQMINSPNITLNIWKISWYGHAEWITNDHSKYWIFDNETIITWWMNVWDEYHWKWHDYMVKMESPMLVDKLRWRLSGNDDFDSWSSVEFWLNRVKSWIVEQKEIESKMIELIDSAKKEIIIEMAYFWDENITEAIINKANSWIPVKIIFPEKANIQHDLNKKVMKEILEKTNWNVSVYFYPSMLHAKVVHVDWERTFFWSANLNKKATEDLWELNILINDKDCEFTQEMIEQLRSDIDKSKAFEAPPKIEYSRLYAYVESIV